MRALAKDPAQRYADADELIVALEHEREALRAYQGAAVPASYPIAATALAEPPATGSMLVVPPLGPPVDEEPPAEDGGGRRWWLWPVLAAVLVAAIAAVLLLTEGKKQVTVPRVVGETEQAAIFALRRAGLQANPTLAPSVRVQTGLVVTQSPPAGSDASKGSTVKIVVSSGPANVPLPDVHGLHPTEASDRLHGAGFVPEVHNTASATVSAGIVIGTEPPAGTVDRQGSTVIVLVSSGPALDHRPRRDGREPVLGAGRDLQRRPGQRHRDPRTVLLAVARKRPQPGTQGRQRSALQHEGQPGRGRSSEGQEGGRARRSWAAASCRPKKPSNAPGSAPRCPRWSPAKPADVGKVLRQSPSGGTHLPKGSTVRIFVGVSGGGTTTPTTTTPTTTTPTTPEPERDPQAP